MISTDIIWSDDHAQMLYSSSQRFGQRYTSEWDYKLLNVLNSAVTLSATWGQYCHWLIQRGLPGGKWIVVKKGQMLLTIRFFIFSPQQQTVTLHSFSQGEWKQLSAMFLYTLLHACCMCLMGLLIISLPLLHLRSPCPSLWVGNVTTELTEKHLWDLFKK